MKSAIRNGLFSPYLSISGSRCSEPAESSGIQTGKKRPSRQTFPPAKRFCPAVPMCSPGVTKESPPALV